MKQRIILLFDSTCINCSKLASLVETLASGKLEVAALNDPEMQLVLSMALPGWRWEPTLVVIRDNKVKAYVGRLLKVHLMRILGVGNAIHLDQVARGQKQMTSEPHSKARRSLFAIAPIITLAAFASSKTVFAKPVDKAAERVFRDEREFGGLIVLNEGESLPEFVQGPQREIPIVCGLGDSSSPSMNNRNVAVDEFVGLSDLLSKTKKPLDALDQKGPLGFELKRANIRRYISDGEECTSSFEYVREVKKGEFQSVWIHAERYPFHPIPLWQQQKDMNTSQDEEIVYKRAIVNKRQFLKLTTDHEIYYHWSDGMSHFVLQCSAKLPASEVDQIVSSLKQIH